MNARLDTIQAAVLLEKLAIFGDEIAARNRVAARYGELLGDTGRRCPKVPDGSTSVWAQYTVRLPAGCDRDAVAARLKAEGMPTAVYYAKPLHRQTAYRDYPVAGNGLPVSDRLAGEVLSLPMHPYLDEATQDRIAEALREALLVKGARRAARATLIRSVDRKMSQTSRSPAHAPFAGACWRRCAVRALSRY